MAEETRNDHELESGGHGSKPKAKKQKARSTKSRRRAARSPDQLGDNEESADGAKDASFTKDRRRLLYICRAIKDRIEQETSPDSIGSIGGLLRELEETDLAQRLGFGVPPLVHTERPHPEDEWFSLLIWNGPHGEGGGELLLSRRFKAATKRGAMPSVTTTCEQVENRDFLISLLQDWIQAIEALEEPEVYPALPLGIILGVNPRLCADLFWKDLRLLRRMLMNDMGGAFLSSYPSPEYWRTQMLEGLLRRMARAAWGSAAGNGVACIRVGKSLRVFHPLGLGTVDVETTRIVSPTAQPPDQCKMAAEFISQWMELREDELLGEQVELGPTDLEVLQALKELGATHEDARVPAKDTAGRVTGSPDVALVKRPLAKLVKLGLVRSRTGKAGGSWLTPAGDRRLARAAKQ